MKFDVPMEVPLLGVSKPSVEVEGGVDLTELTLSDYEKATLILDLYKFEAQMKFQLTAAYQGNEAAAAQSAVWVLKGKPIL